MYRMCLCNGRFKKNNFISKIRNIVEIFLLASQAKSLGFLSNTLIKKRLVAKN